MRGCDVIVGDVPMQDEGEYEGRGAVADDDGVNTVRPLPWSHRTSRLPQRPLASIGRPKGRRGRRQNSTCEKE